MYDDTPQFSDDTTAAPLQPTVLIEDWLQALEALKRQQLRIDHTQKDRPSPALPLRGTFNYDAADIVGPLALAATPTTDTDPLTVTVALTVHHQGMQLRLSGTVEATILFVCDRCLAPFETTVSAHPEELFLLLAQLPKAYHQEEWVSDYADEAESFSPNDTFDLRDWVRQWVVLETAGQHWCSECG